MTFEIEYLVILFFHPIFLSSWGPCWNFKWRLTVKSSESIPQIHFCLGYTTKGHPTCRHQLRCRVDITASITLFEDSLQGCRWCSHKHSWFYWWNEDSQIYSAERGTNTKVWQRGELQPENTRDYIWRIRVAAVTWPGACWREWMCR